ncbi:MAG: hypothetical protein HND57_08115 [Planctomycetes bacterium]|nr:hypothetical protein [Planctomycetota bacterium]
MGKTDAEVREALTYSARSASGQGIGQFVLETPAERDHIAAVARAIGIAGHASLRINPEVQRRAPELTIASETVAAAFKQDIEHAERFFEHCGHNEFCKLDGLHIHFGSQIDQVEPCASALRAVIGLIERLSQAGHTINTLHLAGGLGVDVDAAVAPTPADYAEHLLPLLQPLVDDGLSLILEPGRTIAAGAGVLVTSVQYIRRDGATQYIVVDAGMHTLLRPALYDARHFVWPVQVAPMHVPHDRAPDQDMPGLDTADVVGPISESADFLARGRKLPPVARDDLLAVFDCGAYGSALSARYTTRPLPPEVLVDGSTATVVREPETYENLLSCELKARKLDTQRRVSFS